MTKRERTRRLYNFQRHLDGTISSIVAGYTVEMPTTCNGRGNRDMGFVIRPLGYSDFVHFNANGEPYGMALPKKVIARLIAMREDWLYEKWQAEYSEWEVC